MNKLMMGTPGSGYADGIYDPLRNREGFERWLEWYKGGETTPLSEEAIARLWDGWQAGLFAAPFLKVSANG
jgi:hypothetical protein